MEPNPQDDIFFAATVLAHIAMSAGISLREVALAVGLNEIRSIYTLAHVSHCLPLEQVAQEIADKHGIELGKWKPAKETYIGKVIADFVVAAQPSEALYPDTLDIILSIFTMPFLDEEGSK